jgi:hypothetical protein
LSKRLALLIVLFSLVRFAEAQSQAPYVFQVLPYATVQQSGPYAGTVASKTNYSGTPCTVPTCNFAASNFSGQMGFNSTLGLANSLDAGIATALSVIPLSSPASGVITKIDPATGAELPSSSSLGPIFTERAETIGKHKFYIGLSNQTFHFTSFNGQSLKPIQMLDPGGEPTSVLSAGGTPLPSPPLTYDIGMDVRLSQNVAFLTYGVTGRFDVSVGLPVVHAAVSASGYNQEVYAGNGFGEPSGSNNLCWCTGTLTPGMAPGSKLDPNESGLVQPQINFSGLGKTGFGDMLLRFKGNVLEGKFALALGTDLRLPTGEARNFLGTGAVAVKPFAAMSLATKLGGVVFSPHINVGWQFAGQSILGGQISASSTTSNGFLALAPPFNSTKGYLPDVFSWAVGTEVALGRHNTIVFDLLGNQIGWIHGIPNMINQSVADQAAPQTGTAASAASVAAYGFVSAGSQSFGQYNGAFGYKALLVGNLVATFNMLVRFDNNGLTARATPLYGLSYTF